MSTARKKGAKSVASSAVEEQVKAGTVVVREGDTADELYFIRVGTFVVTPVGRELGPDDYFGEIGVLEGIPRTATVTARTDGVCCA